ncbi:MAG: type II toxin-antitoxin system VapC family toxin [Chlamydiae bacterium]|nr:type II toxin-antitoxin system VapC family toxin [Chlamydiota bacterium]MBI3267227.1 type II toxin-antitoxin system VapC family toxin [Chlamydiota bacterium]
MNLVDSCGWLEYFADGPNARFFAPVLQNIQTLLVPSICILEVFKKVMKERGEDAALQAVALMQQGETVDLDVKIAVSAALIGVQLDLSLADSVIVAIARAHKAVIWTQDSDFRGIERVKYKAKK